MITGDGEIQIMGAADDVQIMGLGADPTAPGGQFAPGTYTSAPGGTPSGLSPAELAHMQQINTTLQVNAAKKQTTVNIAVAVGLVLLLGGGVMYATRK